MATELNQATTLACFTNELRVEDDGWAMLAPFGDFPGVATVPEGADGIRRLRAIQRVTKENATEMVNGFKSVTGRIKRFLRGVPIFVGHPDAPRIGERWPDKQAKGTIADLEVREQGIFCRPVFTNEGIDYLDNHSGLGFSARWTAQAAGKLDGQPVFAPTKLLSAGLTDNPNLPVELLNEAEGANQHDTRTMDRTKLIAGLRKLGVELANDASDPQIEDALSKLGEKLASTAILANEKADLVTERDRLKTENASMRADLGTSNTQRDAARTEFANERKARVELELDKAVLEGRITAADRPQWGNRLVADFANESTALGRQQPKLKTESRLGNVGQRKTELANCGDFSAAVAHFTGQGKKKAEAVRLAMEAAPDLYAAYRDAGGQL